MKRAMSPPAGVNAQLRHLVHYHLDNGMLENALFFATRLHAHEPRNGDATHLLALCNLRLGRHKAAFDCSKPRGHSPPHLGCVYVYAQACLGLERYDVGAQALEKARGLWAGRNHWSKLAEALGTWLDANFALDKHSDTSRRHVPDAAACYCMLGKLYGAFGDTKKAIEYYVESLKLNPFMWDAFTGLCDIGAVVRPQNIFKVTPDMLASLTSLTQTESFDANPFISAPDDPFNTGLSSGGSSLFSKLNGSIPPANPSFRDAETPTSNGQNIHDDDMMGQNGNTGGPVMNDLTHAPSRKTRTMTHKRTVSGHSANSATAAADPAAPPRRSTRLQSVQSHTHSMISGIRSLSSRNPTATTRETETKERRELRKVRATGTKGKTSTVGNVGRVVSGNRKPMIDPPGESTKLDSRPPVASIPPPKMTVASDSMREREALDWLLDLLLKIGSGYRYLSRFECAKAIEAFNLVPAAQRDTPWVLSQIGRAYSERSMWAEAEKVFLRVRERAPSYVEDMDIFSTVLWQQKKETDLAYLAHSLNSQDRLAPQAWVALGNALSLERDHDQAIKCLARATQLDPKFAYAYTLQGHEHISNEELDKAMLAFRLAISANPRHYNGWYGIGRVYEMQHKFDFADKHYRAAFNINPSNALLAMRIGLVSSLFPFPYFPSPSHFPFPFPLLRTYIPGPRPHEEIRNRAHVVRHGDATRPQVPAGAHEEGPDPAAHGRRTGGARRIPRRVGRAARRRDGAPAHWAGVQAAPEQARGGAVLHHVHQLGSDCAAVRQGGDGGVG